MTSQDFNVGDEVIVTGIQDGVEFSDTPCTIVDIHTENYKLYQVSFIKRDTKKNQFGRDNSEMEWWLNPRRVDIFSPSKQYDPTQQPYDEDDI